MGQRMAALKASWWWKASIRTVNKLYLRIERAMETRNHPAASDLLINFFGNTISRADAGRASAHVKIVGFILSVPMVIAESRI